jgi:8-oxo-dGTP pyrophosphatase MutT (NUDIX family)
LKFSKKYVMSLSFDPQTLPVLATDNHLLSPPMLHLQAPWLRQRFAAPPLWAPEITGEPLRLPRALTPAAVLIALVLRPQLTVLLTRRTTHLTHHAGQISFPGGRTEAFDVNPVATALREAHEEIGLDSQHAEVLGSLPTYTTGTGFSVTPVVALVSPQFSMQIDTFEVAEVFEVPLAFLMNPAHHQRHEITAEGVQRAFFSMPYPRSPEHGLPAQHYFVWGATAAMLRNLYQFLMA